ncbi:MAG: phasin [Hyphomicrobiales bacterium]|nr:phasin [Hyphomicrobiales bacterium]
MAQLPYEIPAEMRDFAEKSVEQARKAFEGFIGAAQKAVGTMDNSAFSMPTGVKDVGTKAMSYAEANVKAAFDHAQKLVHAKDLQEVMQLQSEYLKAQMATLQEQAKEIGSTVQKAVTPKSS